VVRRSRDEAVGHTVCVNVVSGDLPAQVDGCPRKCPASALPGVRLVQSGEFLERRSSREAMRHVICIKVVTYTTPNGLMLKLIVPWPELVPASGASYLVMVLSEPQPETHWKP